MPSISTPSVTAQYFDASEQVTQFVDALVRDSSLVEAPKERFKELDQLVIATSEAIAREKGPSNPLVIPELLCAKLNFAHGILDLTQGKDDSAHECFETMICMAEVAYATDELKAWITHEVYVNGPILQRALELIEVAEGRITTFPALESAISVLAAPVEFSEERSPIDLVLSRRSETLEPPTRAEIKLIDQRVEKLVELIAVSNDSMEIGKMFTSINAELADAGRRVYATDDAQILTGLGLIDAKLHLLRYEIEKANEAPDSARLEYYRAHVDSVTDHAGCHEELGAWKSAVNQTYPKLLLAL